jgi:hypothetical protein
MGLGPVSTKPDDKRITLSDARQKAAAARSLLIDGLDPIDARNARRAQAALQDAQAATFRHCADEYIKDNQAIWKNGSPAPMGLDTENLRPPRDRSSTGGRGRYRLGAEDPSDLEKRMRRHIAKFACGGRN